MEVSPKGDVVAILWAKTMVRGRIDLYDLSSGKCVRSWDTPVGWMMNHGLAWDRDGKLLLLSIANEPGCASPSSHPDVFAFDADSGSTKHKFTSGLLVGGIAVVLGDRVLAVDDNCLGVFRHHDPKLRVFDLFGGKKVREISGRGSGVRYVVSSSADGRRFLAFTGKMKAGFDWSDMVPYDRVVDETFSVWSAADYSGIATSQNILGVKDSDLRLSAHGRYAVSCGEASFVYELPQNRLPAKQHVSYGVTPGMHCGAKEDSQVTLPIFRAIRRVVCPSRSLIM